MSDPLQTTKVLQALSQGDASAADRLMPLVYDELRSLAKQYLRQQDPSHTLQATALVHEAFLKLCDKDGTDWRDRSHFFAVGARAMRSILVDHARGKARDKRGGGRQRLALDENVMISSRCDEDVLALDEALTKLAQLDQRQSQIVELRFFGGLTVQEVAEVLGISKRTIESEWTMIRAWLRRELSEDAE
jgi:RNA polymerase sigma-70 factor (ECF subfamily)